MELPLFNAESRDLRVDFVRGLALWWISIDHTPENILRYTTLRKFALADAAEVFVFLSGYTAGLVYSKVLDQRGWSRASGTVLRRTGVVYSAHILIFVISVGLVGYLGHAFPGASSMIHDWRLDAVAEHPFEAMQETVLLRYQPEYMDILPLYVVLLTMLAAALPLLWRPRLLLGLSFTAYLAVQVLGIEPQVWPDGPWTFNPLAWQLLFVIGVVLGNRLPGPSWPSISFRWKLFAVCVVFLLISRPLQVFYYHRQEMLLLLAYAPKWIISVVDSLGPFMPYSDASKTSLHPLRLLSILALVYTFRFIIVRDAPWLRSLMAGPFVMMGQHSLVVFCASNLLAALMHVVLQWSGGWPIQLAANFVELLALLAVAIFATWLNPVRKPPPHHGTNPQIKTPKEIVLQVG